MPADPCVNTILINKHVNELDLQDTNMEYVKYKCETKRLAAIQAIEDYHQAMKNASDEHGLSHFWFDIKEDLEL